MKMLVVTQCTSRKATRPLPAEQLYRGAQHFEILRGVYWARRAGWDVQVYIVSAMYGVIPGDRVITPYDQRFEGATARERGRELDIPAEFRRVVGLQHYDRGFVLLGADYWTAVDPRQEVGVGGLTEVYLGGVCPKGWFPKKEERLLVRCFTPKEQLRWGGQYLYKGKYFLQQVRELLGISSPVGLRPLVPCGRV